MSERSSRGRNGLASESEDLESARATAKQVDSGDVDDDDSTLLSDEAKAPPRRASVGWGTESAVSDDKAGGDASARAGLSAAAASDSKRSTAGRRRRGSDNPSDAKANKNRYFDDDGDSNGAYLPRHSVACAALVHQGRP